MKNKLLTSKANLNLIGFIALLMLLIPSLGWSQYSGSGTFTKITSTSDLTDGYYVIAYGATQAMNNVNGSNNYFGNTAISPSGGTTITNPNAAIVWKIQTDGGGKTIYNESSAKYVSYTGSSNQAQEVSSVSSNNQRWTFAYASDVFTVRNLAVTARYLKYNTTYPRFACYTNLQQDLTLYKMAQVTTVPGAPTISSVTAGNGQLSVAFTAPASNGGAAITDYKYSLNGINYTSAGTTVSPIVISGLTNGTSYSVTLKAVNSIGDGTASSAVSGTPRTIPSAPTITDVTAGNGTLSLAFTQDSNGGSAITNYKYSLNGGTSFTAFSPTQTTSPVLISGLTNGTTYNVQLVAVNAAGDSSFSTTATGTPYTVPSAPVITSITEGNEQLTINFTAASENGSALVGYAYSLNGGATFTSIETNSGPIVVTGLTNGTSYAVQLRAVNAAGNGVASSTWNAIPRTTASAPTITSITPGNGTLSVAFTAPTYDGGAAITGYKFSLNGGVNFSNATTSGSSILLSGLQNGTTYEVQILAVNAAGDGTVSNMMQGTPVAPSQPTIETDKTTLNALTTVYGTPSLVESFVVSGTTLSGDITITAPTGFEVSTTSDTTGFDSTQVLTQVGGNVPATTVYVRLSAAAKPVNAPFSGDVTVVSTGASTMDVAIPSSSVTAKVLTINGITVNDKVYDGNTTATISGTATLVGVVGTDVVSVSGTPTFTFSTATAGANKAVTVLGYALNGTDASNYTLTQPTGLTATITKANQTIAAISTSESRTFGDSSYSLSTTSDSGLAVTYSSSNLGVATVALNGTVTIVGAGSTTFTVAQAGNENYNAATSLTQELTVAKADQTLSAIATIMSKTFGDAPYSLTTSASSGLTVVYSSSNTNVATIAANGTVTIVGAGSTILTAAQAGNINYNPAVSVTQELTVDKADQTIALATADTRTSTDAAYTLPLNASSGLPVSYTSSNNAVATISGNTVTLAGGVGSTTITANQSGNANYNAAPQVIQTLTVTQGSLALAKYIFNGTACTPSTRAASNVAPNLTFSAASVTGPSCNSNSSTTFSVGGSSWGTSFNSSRYVEFTVTPNAGYLVNATSLTFDILRTSAGATNATVRSSVDNYASDLITPFSVGTTSSSKSITLNGASFVNRASAITFRIYGWGGNSTGDLRLDNITLYGYTAQIPAPSITSALTASGTVGAAFNYAITASNSPASFNASGLPSGLSVNTSTGVISGTPTIGGIFNVSIAATNLTGTDTKELVIAIAKADQVITFTSLASQTYGGAPFSLNGTSSSGLAVTYTSSNTAVASISGNTVTIVGAGTATITASQAGNENYNAAVEVTNELVVNKADQFITFEALANRLDNEGTFTLTATASSGLPVSFSSENEALLSISGTTATIHGPGTVVITASQAGNENYNAASLVSREQVIVNTQLASQTITFSPLVDKVYGDEPFALNATASSGLEIVYSSSDESIASVSGHTITILKPGTVTITASQAGNETYNPAQAVTQSLTITEKELTVTDVVVADKVYDGTTTASLLSYQLNGVVGSDEVGLTSTAVFAQTTVGQNIAVTTNMVLTGAQADRYILTQPTTVTGTIVKANQVISFDVIPSKTYGDLPFTINATGGQSGQPIVFTSADDSIATITDNQVTIVGGGTVQITATQLGNENYNDATPVTQELVVAPKVQYINGFTSLGTKYVSTQPFTLSATATSALDIVYSSSNTAVATINGNVVTIVGVGETEITASQEGNANFAPVTQVRTLKIIPDPIAAWNVYGLNQTATATASKFTNLVTTSNGNLLTRGTGATASTGANSFRTTGFKNDGISVANTDYFQFKLQPQQGYQMSLHTIDASFIGTSTFYATPGVTSQFAYSLNGTNFTLIGTPVTSTNLTMDTIDLSQIPELQNIQNGTTVTFRYYASGQTATGGWGFSSPASDANALAIGGTLEALPATPSITVVQNCNGTATLSTEATGNLLWSTGATTASITVTDAGNYSVSQTINGVTSYPATVNVTPVTVTAPIVENQAFCAITMPKVADILAQGQNIKVYSDSEKTNLLNANQELVSGDYYVTQTIGTCESEVTQVQITVNTATTYYVDADGDGYGSTTTAMLCSLTAPAGYATNNTDCDDANALVWQSASFYVDADADGYDNGSATVCYGATTPAGYATTTNGSDCDDANALVWQSASFYVDADADGYDNGSATVCYGATTPVGYATTTNGSDCNDSNADIHATVLYYVDADGDGYGSTTTAMLCSLTVPAGYATNNTDCDDANALVWQSASLYVDADADGYDNGSATVCYGATTPVGYATTTNGSDCNDSNAAIHATVLYYVDADGDGYGSTTTAMLCSLTAPAGYATNNTDCDDANAQVWRSASFYVDADADGYDNGSATVCYGATTPVGYATTTNGSDCNDSNAAIHATVLYYVDADGDGYGSTTTAMLCSLTAPAGYATNNTDCDDANALVWQSASFYVDADADGYDNGSATVCYGATTPVGYATTTNGSDCNDSNAAIHATVMYYVDADGDGYGSTTTAMLCSLTAPAGYATNNTDCNDSNASVWRTGSFYVDTDGDSYGAGTAVSVCYGATTPSGYATNNTDCNNSNAQVWRSATFYVDADADGYDNGSATVCYGATTPVGYATTTNGSDCNDANAQVWRTGSFYVDTDGDTYGAGDLVSVCYGSTTPSGYATRSGDCNDANASVNPGATEICGNGIDDNCNGSIDEGCGTQVQASQCGVTLAALNTVISADVVTGAQQYRFEVTNGSNVRVYTPTTASSFNLTQLTGGAAYATTYSVRVAVKLNNVWSGYGAACNVTTPTPLTQVQASQCGITIGALNTTIYADAFTGATAYTFEVSDGTTVRTYNSANRYFNLTQLTGGATMSTAYSIRVAITIGGVTHPYGSACIVNTPSTKVQTSQCGITLSNLSTLIYADAMTGATAYRFEVTNGTTVRTVDSATRSFMLTQLTGGAAYGTAYSIRVAIQYNSVWQPYGPSCTVSTVGTQVQTSQCGITLTDLSLATTISADAITGATGYRFEVTNGTTVRTYDSPTNSFNLTQLTGGAAYATTYSIRVAADNSGVMGGYGTSCTITTPQPITRVQDSQCGTTLEALNTLIYAYAINGATSYKFEVTNGATVRTYTSNTNSFNLTQLPTPAPVYDTAYSVKVAVLYNGTWYAYGSACIVTPVRTTKVQTSQCGVVLSGLTTTIYANAFTGAQQYRFEVTNGSDVRTYTSVNRYFNLSQLTGGGSLGTTYSIRVAIQFNNVWQPYGSACLVSTPAITLTKVKADQCGASLVATNTIIYADAVSGATAYRFEVTNGTTVRTFDASTYYFNLTQLSGEAITLGTVYSIRVAAQVTGVWGAYGTACTVSPNITKVQDSQCGTSLAAMNTTIYANAVSGATNYRFKVTYLGTELGVYETTNRYFNLTQLTGVTITRGTTYNVTVSVKIGANWGAYGAGCNVTTPAVPLTKVRANQCGTTLTALNNTIYCDAVTGAEKYKFEIVGGGITRYYVTSSGSVYYFNLTQLPGVNYLGTTYTIRVAAMLTGVYGAYGEACTITTPPVPTTKLQATQCGITLTSSSVTLYADALTGATDYRFEVTNGLNVRTLETVNRYFRLIDLVGGAVSGTTYSVRVAVKYNGEWQGYGSSCNVTTPGTAPTVRVDQDKEVPVTTPIFSVKGYPNPYNAYFVLSLETPSESKVGISVFDMAGRLIEEKEVEPAMLENLPLGANWPIGVYNIIVTQDSQVKTIKMVKNE